MDVWNVDILPQYYMRHNPQDIDLKHRRESLKTRTRKSLRCTCVAIRNILFILRSDTIIVVIIIIWH
jgi:hypothetical protein